MKQFKNHSGFAHLLNLLIPGLGHAYWGEYLFAAFIFLIMLLAATLFFFCFLVSLPFGLRAVLFGLPALFYLFTFVDLHRAIQRRRAKVRRSVRTAWLFLVLGVAAQLILPVAPANFLIHNPPGIAQVEDNRLEPLLENGDICYVNTVAYRADLFFFDRPMTHALPDRWDLTQYHNSETGLELGLALGFGDEELAFINDTLFVDGYPLHESEDPPPIYGGEMSLTLVDPGSILVATLANGKVHRVRQVPISDVVGKVHRLF
jgi:hypothetical protein